MRTLTNRLGVIGAHALLLSALFACAEVPSAPIPPTTAHRLIACDDTGYCPEDGEPPPPPPPAPTYTTVKLTWFADGVPNSPCCLVPNPTNDYYEVRTYFNTSLDKGTDPTRLNYHTFFLHGDAFAKGEFTSLDTGLPYVCGTIMHVEIWSLNVFWGHVVDSNFEAWSWWTNGTGERSGFAPVHNTTVPYQAAFKWTGCQ